MELKFQIFLTIFLCFCVSMTNGTEDDHEKIMHEFFNETLVEYKLRINEDIDYGMENFEEFIDELHQNLSSVLLSTFVQDTQKFNDEVRQNKFKAALEAEMGKSYKVWRKLILQNSKKITNVRKIKFESTCERIASEIEFNRENFEAKSSEVKQKAIQEFSDIARVFFDHSLVETNRKILEREIENFFKSFKVSKLEEFRKFEEFLREQLRIKLETEVQTLARLYDEEIDRDVDLNQVNFPQYLDQRHHTIKNNFKDRLAELAAGEPFLLKDFKAKLEKTLDEKFATWKPQKIKAYRNHQQITKSEREEIQNCILEKLIFEYEEQLIKTLSMDHDNFEVFIDAEHKKLKQEILSQFVSEAKSSDVSKINELGSEVEKIFSRLKDKKLLEIKDMLLKEQNKLEEEIEAAIRKELSEYEKAMNTSIDYSQANFESWLDDKHEKEKGKVIKSFLNFSGFNKSQNQQFDLDKLKHKIDETYFDIKESETEIHKSKINANIETFLDSRVNISLKSYEKEFLSDINYNVLEFELEIGNRHEKCKLKAIESFKNSTKGSEYNKKRVLYRRKLGKLTDETFRKWRKDNRRENERRLNEKYVELKAVLDKKFSTLKKSFEAFNFTGMQFDSFETKLKDATKKAIKEFQLETKTIADYIAKNQFENLLQDKIKKYSRKMELKYTALQTDGIWVPWNRSPYDFPPNAVTGGNLGGYLCGIARFDDKTGEWCAKLGSATAYHNGVKYTSGTFEILTHINWKFVRYLGSNIPIKSDEHILCRDANGFSDAKHVGIKEGSYCRVVHNGSPQIFSEYETLVVAE